MPARSQQLSSKEEPLHLSENEAAVVHILSLSPFMFLARAHALRVCVCIYIYISPLIYLTVMCVRMPRSFTNDRALGAVVVDCR